MNGRGWKGKERRDRKPFKGTHICAFNFRDTNKSLKPYGDYGDFNPNEHQSRAQDKKAWNIQET